MGTGKFLMHGGMGSNASYHVRRASKHPYKDHKPHLHKIDRPWPTVRQLWNKHFA